MYFLEHLRRKHEEVLAPELYERPKDMWVEELDRQLNVQNPNEPKSRMHTWFE